jgi:hypothetical protein
MGHSGQQTKSLIFLPYTINGTVNIQFEIEFRMKIVPAGKPGFRDYILGRKKEYNQSQKDGISEFTNSFHQ